MADKLIIHDLESLINLIIEARLDSLIKQTYEQTYFESKELELGETACHNRAIDFVYDDFVSHAWTDPDEVEFTLSEEEFKKILSDRYFMTVGYSVEGLS